MASTTQKWFIGCGIGCGLMILIIVAIGGGIFFAVKDVVKEAESIEATQEALRDVYGTPDEFIPAADGSIAPDRMEAFLATREAHRQSREKLAEIIYLLDDDDGVEVEANALDKIKAGLTLIPSMLSFLGERNQHLLDNNIGVGEYTYIYSIAYFNVMNKNLTDGPSFQITGQDGDDSGVQWNMETSGDDGEVLEKREREIRRHLHRLQMSFLNNQINISGGSAELTAEREKMLSSSRRLLWEEGLPEVIRQSVLPYTSRLDESYSSVLNVVELGMVNQD